MPDLTGAARVLDRTKILRQVVDRHAPFLRHRDGTPSRVSTRQASEISCVAPGVSLEPLTVLSQTRKTRADAGAPLPVKYRGPNGEAWSGRGIAPRWLKAFELEGQ